MHLSEPFPAFYVIFFQEFIRHTRSLRELPIIDVEMCVFSLLIAKQINELYLHNSILTTRVKEMT